MMRLTQRVCLNADKNKVVDCNGEEAAYVLGMPGAAITEKDAKRLGLKGEVENYEDLPARGYPTTIELAPEDVVDNADLYSDQSEAGKRARADAQDQQNQREEVGKALAADGAEEDSDKEDAPKRNRR